MAEAANSPPPNIVLILVDDQGWNGTSVQMDPNVPGSRSDFYQTPNLEALASAGMRFSNAYSAAPVCAPTRASLVTGKSPAQLQMTDLVQAQPGTERYEGGYTGLPLTPPTPEFLDLTQMTLPRLLKQANSTYQTAHYGKWHLDIPAHLTPEYAGYDFSDDPRQPPEEIDPWGVEQLARLANAFMQDSVASGNPFFVQISEHAVHPPIHSRSVLREKYENLPPGAVHDDPAYAAMTEDLDASVGTVLDKIQELGIAENTFVIYASDNGAPVGYSSNAPLKYGKGGITEGGIRIPFIVRGPGIEAGSASDVSVMTTDLMTTIAAMAGYEGPTPEGVEGADLLPLLHNGGELPEGMDYLSRQFAEHGEVYFHSPHNVGVGQNFRTKPSSAVRDGDYKLVVEYGENGGADQFSLYNLRTDIRESINLAYQLPAKTAELKGMLDNYLASVDASFAYDVKAPVHLAWDASQPGNVAGGWRSTIDVNYKARETWTLGAGAEQPQAVDVDAYQPGLPDRAFEFEYGDVMRRKFFHVGDAGPRQNTLTPGTPDFDRSGSVDIWFRTQALVGTQLLFESGDKNSGISLTMGDADANGMANDLRFRVLGKNGESLTVTAPVDDFANPVDDFIHATAVFDDDANDRHVDLYINGALAARVNGLTGSAHSLQWDGIDQAGIGKYAGGGIGGNGGTGPLPFFGRFTGQIAELNFWNYALADSQIAANYNTKLDPANIGIRGITGGTTIAWGRPTDVSLGATEASSLLVTEERQQSLTSALAVDAIVNGGESMTAGNPMAAGELAAGTDFISYLLHFDPIGSDSQMLKVVSGSVKFKQDILGLVFDANSLAATDPILGSIGNYGADDDRGLSLSDENELSISPDRRTLNFNFSVAGDDMLQLRVVTESAIFIDEEAFAEDLEVWKSSFGIDAMADADRDGDSDGTDFLIWQRRLGAVDPESAAGLQAWKSAFGVNGQADQDSDGDTDGTDFLTWQRELGNAAVAASAPIPEPTALTHCAIGTALIWALRRSLKREFNAPLRTKLPCFSSTLTNSESGTIRP